MGFEIKHYKIYLILVNVGLIILGLTSFTLGCSYIGKMSIERLDLYFNEMTLTESIESITCVVLCEPVGKLLIIFGMGVLSLSILTIVGTLKQNMFILQFVTALLIICSMCLALVGIGALIVTKSSFISYDTDVTISNYDTDVTISKFVGYDPKFVLKLNETQMKKMSKTYDCCFDRYCPEPSMSNCLDIFFNNVLHYRDIVVPLFVTGALLHIIVIVLAMFLIKDLKDSRKPRLPPPQLVNFTPFYLKY
ncbi:hypothetical protein QE152_g9641 [Popillia japonica]|uniref:Tetraspanin n=1 Tax=Popillia japonica TaxID=7064 RepID=A0AAW1LXC3_POPJA